MDYYFVAFSALLFAGVLTSIVFDRFGVPALLLFLAIGMLAGSDGPGGFHFEDTAFSQLIGVLALVYILFAGGLTTEWAATRPVLKEGVLLATCGVLPTATIVGIFVKYVLNFSWIEGLLLGAIISSTDAAAVFSVLRAKSLNLKGHLKPLLEFESGSNDPMAVFLTVGFIGLLTDPDARPAGMLLAFVLQMLLGAAGGYIMGQVMIFFVRRLRLGHDGLYPVLTLSLVLLTYGILDLMGGNGFLAVYVAGIVIGNRKFVHKQMLLSFHDGLAWLMQIAMFVTLGLLVFPSRLVPIMGMGVLIAACLIFVARPLSVFLLTAFSGWSLQEKTFVSWVGLRGAVPIILATYPLLAGVERAQFMFNVVFFVVITSVVLQGTTLPLVAKWLRVDDKAA